jgi:hypothetical protein
MNRDGVGRADLMRYLEKMINVNEALKNPNNEGLKLFWNISKTNFSRRLERVLGTQCKALTKRKGEQKITGADAIAIILLTKLLVHNIRIFRWKYWNPSNGTAIIRGLIGWSQYRTDEHGRYEFRYQLGSQSGCSIRLQFRWQGIFWAKETAYWVQWRIRPQNVTSSIY